MAVRLPRLGDVVGLPAWLPDLPYRVLNVRDAHIDGWIWLGGYLLDGYTVRPAAYLVPTARLRYLPDPVWGAAHDETTSAAPHPNEQDTDGGAGRRRGRVFEEG